MQSEDKSLLRLIRLTYSGKELEAALMAWQDFPTYVKDCRLEREMKKKAREARMKKYLAGMGESINS